MAYEYRLRCCNCGTDFALSLSALTKNKPLHCLKCGAKMELELWNRLVDAFWTIEEINLDFSKANLEKRAAKFDIRITDSNSDTVI